MKASRVIVIAGLMAIATSALPERVQAQRSGVEIWSAVCGRCHTIQPPDRYTAKDWASIMAQMTINARLTDAQAAAILQFLQQGARRPAAEEDGAADSAPAALAQVDGRPGVVTRDSLRGKPRPEPSDSKKSRPGS